jgi:hypothetical protein
LGRRAPEVLQQAVEIDLQYLGKNARFGKRGDDGIAATPEGTFLHYNLRRLRAAGAWQGCEHQCRCHDARKSQNPRLSSSVCHPLSLRVTASAPWRVDLSLVDGRGTLMMSVKIQATTGHTELPPRSVYCRSE